MGCKCCFDSQRATLHVPVLRYIVRTCMYAYSAGDTNSYAVHWMEQDSESERLRKRQATTPHRHVKTSRLLEARWCLHTQLLQRTIYVNVVRVCYANNTFFTRHHHLRIGPYKGSVNSVQIQMPFHAIVQCWTLLPPFRRLISS